MDVAGRTLYDRFDALDIGLPCTIGTTVRVRDLNTKCNALAADFAFCHSWLHLLPQRGDGGEDARHRLRPRHLLHP